MAKHPALCLRAFRRYRAGPAFRRSSQVPRVDQRPHRPLPSDHHVASAGSPRWRFARESPALTISGDTPHLPCWRAWRGSDAHLCNRGVSGSDRDNGRRLGAPFATNHIQTPGPRYTGLADDLIERATKDQLADVARPLALNICWYHQRYGDVPQEDLLGMVRAQTLDEDARALLLHGMQNLVSALAEVMGVAENGGDEAMHWGSRGGAERTRYRLLTYQSDTETGGRQPGRTRTLPDRSPGSPRRGGVRTQRRPGRWRDDRPPVASTLDSHPLSRNSLACREFQHPLRIPDRHYQGAGLA
jgi:hypothetical protein